MGHTCINCSQPKLACCCETAGVDCSGPKSSQTGGPPVDKLPRLPPDSLQDTSKTTLQLDCDLAALTDQYVQTDAASLIAVELALCPESAPSPNACALPCLSFDPHDDLGLSAFSSFTPRTYHTGSKYTPDRLKRRRMKKEQHAEERAKRAKVEAAVVPSTPLDLPRATLPRTPRAGHAGTEIKVDMEGQPTTPRSAGRRAKLVEPVSTPSRSSPSPSKPQPLDSPISPTSFYKLAGADSSPTPTSPLPCPSFANQTKGDRMRAIEAQLIHNHPGLEGFTFCHRSGIPGQATTFIDSSRRAFATRIERPEAFSDLASEFEQEIADATSKIAPFKTDGSRGKHEVRQIGVHRESGAVEPVYSSQFTRSPAKWLHLMRGKAFKRVRGHISKCLETHYPAIFAYHRSLAVMLAARGLHFLFGAFAAFCLNLGGRVACLRHRDKHNLGPGLCGGLAALSTAIAQLILHSTGVLPFGRFDSSRSGWLVLEEARLCIELGALDLALFASAIFTHWNTAIHNEDVRQSLASWCGASLFLWSELGGRSLSHLGDDVRAKVIAENKTGWLKAWERFPVL